VNFNLSSSTSLSATAFSLARIFQFAHGQQEFHRRRQRAEAVAQFFRQIFPRRFFSRLREFAVDFNPMLR
jgi:hypothetical protein